MRNLVAAAMMTLLLVGIIGCKKNGEIVKREGLDKEFMLRQISVPYQNDATMFFYIGNQQEKWFGAKQIKFMWGRNQDELNVTTVSLSNVNFVIDEAKEMPTAVFVFDSSWLASDANDAAAENQAATILFQQTSVPNFGVYGVTIHIHRQHYIDIMLAVVSQK